MGLLTDFFLAKPTEVAERPAADIQATAYRCLQAKAVDSVKLEDLAAILGIKDLALEPRPLDSDEGPWLFQLPPGLVSTLAALDDKKRTEAGAAWANSEEWQFDKTDAAVVSAVLSDLCALARDGVRDDKAMWLWMSL